ncbi:MAG: bifunctional phosphoglucose/phosphomannose isomerase [Desulfurococcus sp.]|nr:bifunctional phosphoglucose/phosphomannose isomerase [Desulfurococcus sp.]
MEEMYRGWVNQIEEALSEWGVYKTRGGFDKVVVLGMGGSGVVGDVISTLSTVLGGPVTVSVKSHRIPSYVDSDTLVVAVSYSGNTLETILAVEEALERAGEVVVASSGGRLREIALKRGLLYVKLPGGLAPRASLPSMLFKVLGLLDSSGLTVVDRRSVEETLIFLKSTLSSSEDLAAEIAEWAYRAPGLLVIATHSPLESLAVRGKNEFNENSKIPVKVDVAPEWMHNDIVGYEAPSGISFKVLEIVDPEDRVGARLVDFMHTVYEDAESVFYRLTLQGGSLLDKIMYGSLVLGLASSKLARLRGLNPLDTKSIARYKEAAPGIFPSPRI